MDNKKISIIIPAYNAEKYINKSLDSVLSQTYQNIEVIVIDDGSKDNTLEILDDYAKRDSRVKVLHKKNGGVSAARNDGLKIASGDCIGFVDSDDEIEPDMFKILLENMEKYDADISHCGYKLIRPDGKTFDFHGTRKLKRQDNYQGVKDLLVGKIVEPGTCNKLFKKTLLEGVYFPENIKFNEDLYFCVEAFHKAKNSVFYDVPLYRYYLREGSATTTANNSRIDDIISVAKNIVDLFDKNEYKQLAMVRFCDVCIQMYNCNLRGNGILDKKIPGIQRDFFETYKLLKKKTLRLRLIYFLQKHMCSFYDFIYKKIYIIKFEKRKHKV